MKKSKRLLSFLLVLCLVCALLPTSAFAAAAVTSVTINQDIRLPLPGESTASYTKRTYLNKSVITTVPADAVNDIASVSYVLVNDAIDANGLASPVTESVVDGSKTYRVRFLFTLNSKTTYSWSEATGIGEKRTARYYNSATLSVGGSKVSGIDTTYSDKPHFGDLRIDYNAVTKLTLTGLPAPKAGEKASAYTKGDSIKLTCEPKGTVTAVKSLTWRDSNDKVFTGVLEEGKTYEVQIALDPQPIDWSGQNVRTIVYANDDATACTVDGAEPKKVSTLAGDRTLSVVYDYTVPERKAINNIAIGGRVMPKAGDKVDSRYATDFLWDSSSSTYITSSPVGSMTSGDISWRFLTVNDGPITTSTFQAGKTYHAVVSCKPSPGFKATSATKAFVNDIEAIKVAPKTEDGVEKVYITIPYTVPVEGDDITAVKTTPPTYQEGDFLFSCDDSFIISGRGLVLTGTVKDGKVKVGDTVVATMTDGTAWSMPVLGLEMFRKNIDEIRKGDSAGVLVGEPFGASNVGPFSAGATLWKKGDAVTPPAETPTPGETPPPAAADPVLTIDTVKGGKITASPSAPKAGDKVRLTVTPDEGYQYVTMSVLDTDGGEIVLEESGKQYVFTMPAKDVTITPAFQEIPAVPHTVSVAAAEGGKVTASPETARKGDTVKLTVKADEGYELSSITVKESGGKSVTAEQTSSGFTFTMPDKDVNIKAVFKAKKVDIKITKQPRDITVAAGEMAGFSVTAIGTDLHYEWWGVDAGMPEKFGTDSASLSLDDVKSDWDGMEFWCKVSNTTGTLESARAHLTVLSGAETSWVAPAIVSTGVNPDASGTAYQSTQPVDIGGKKVELQAYALKDPVTGYDTNYVKIRDVAAALNGTVRQFDVTWTDAVNLVVVAPYDHPNGQENKTPYSGDRPYIKATAPTKVNGAVVDIGAFVIFDDAGGGSTYYKLRDVGQALGFNVGWSLEAGIFIEPGASYTFDD